MFTDPSTFDLRKKTKKNPFEFGKNKKKTFQASRNDTLPFINNNLI